jgi:uncharacterized protein
MKYPFKLSVLLASLALSVFAAAPQFKVPPLNDPATTTTLPGKFIWVDLFTADPAVSTKFYAELFGWQWEVVDHSPQAYQIAYQNGLPVAGAVKRPPAKGEATKALWIGYISVPDVGATVKQVQARGGRTLLAPRLVPDRGELALLADPQGALFGVMKSSSGDPGDYRPELGEWYWTQLFADDAAKATAFYQAVIGYDVHPASSTLPTASMYLIGSGQVRASVAQLPDSKFKPSWLGFITVASLAETTAKAQALGGAVLVPPHRVSDGAEVAVIADPLGAPVGLIHSNPTSPGDK